MAFLTQHRILEKSVGGFWCVCKRWLSLTSRRQAPMPFLTDDLILEILIRSPAKSVGRFRCVCKRWLSLTSDPKFILAHASRAPTSGFFVGPAAVVRHRLLGARPRSSPPAWFSRQLAINSSCNGLMLLCNQNLPSCCQGILPSGELGFLFSQRRERRRRRPAVAEHTGEDCLLSSQRQDFFDFV